jgi:hypothetical protein
MNCRILLLVLLLAIATTLDYPLYKQCNSKWSNLQLGTSPYTICLAGSLITSVSMGLTGTGRPYTPATLNTWLKEHGGYAQGNLFIWGSIAPLGFSYLGKIANSNM